MYCLETSDITYTVKKLQPSTYQVVGPVAQFRSENTNHPRKEHDIDLLFQTNEATPDETFHQEYVINSLLEILPVLIGETESTGKNTQVSSENRTHEKL